MPKQQVSAFADNQEWVVLGRFTSPFGVKGWLKLYSYTEPMENIGNYDPIWLRSQGKIVPLQVEQIKAHGKGLVAKLKDCDNRDDTAAYTGAELLVAKEQLEALSAGEYYWSDLIGMQVVNMLGESLGVVASLMETGSNDVLLVKPAVGSIDDRERLLPYLPDQVVLDVDLLGKKMTVDWDADF